MTIKFADDMITLWTIQTPDVYETLKTKGIYHCKESNSDFYKIKSFHDAYNWMIEQMKTKEINTDVTGIIPIWAWYIYDGKYKKPDLRKSGFEEHGTNMVCMEIEIPKSQVLLSDFDAWHGVLNKWYIHNEDSEEKWDKEQEIFDKLSLNKKEILMHDSWNRIFDIESRDEFRENNKYVQAVFWELCMSQVKKVQFFTAR